MAAGPEQIEGRSVVVRGHEAGAVIEFRADGGLPEVSEAIRIFCDELGDGRVGILEDQSPPASRLLLLRLKS